VGLPVALISHHPSKSRPVHGTAATQSAFTGLLRVLQRPSERLTNSVGASTWLPWCITCAQIQSDVGLTSIHVQLIPAVSESCQPARTCQTSGRWLVRAELTVRRLLGGKSNKLFAANDYELCSQPQGQGPEGALLMLTGTGLRLRGL
jgi:hypothetical protein